MALLHESSLVPNLRSSTYLPDGSLLVSQRSTLFDGKILNADETDFWQTVGTGTPAFSNNTIAMPVTANQWIVAQARRRSPYFSGKPQVIEFTCDSFHTQAGVIKRIGYFSSSAVTPFDTLYDGFWIEDDGTTKRLMTANLGTITANVPLSEWGEEWANFNFENFSVFTIYFVWLGGAALISFGATASDGFRYQTQAQYISSRKGTISSSPNQPMRYEIRSTGGVGTLTRICSFVGTAGSISESGKSLSVYNSAAVTTNTVGTTFVLKGIRKRADRRDIAVKIQSIGCASLLTSDAGILLLLLNPTLSAPLSYSPISNIEEATATGQTVTNVGRVLVAVPIGNEGGTKRLDNDFLTWLSMGIENTPDEYILAFQALTNNQSRAGMIYLLEYI